MVDKLDDGMVMMIESSKWVSLVRGIISSTIRSNGGGSDSEEEGLRVVMIVEYNICNKLYIEWFIHLLLAC